MSWSRLAKILQTKPLDRETKLMIIDLLSVTHDPLLEREIFAFIFAWEEADAQTQKALREGIERITQEYKHSTQLLNQQTQTFALTIADDLARQQRIEDLRKHIQTL